jgi:hypothetical protein
MLVGHLDIDVFEVDRIAEVFGDAVEFWLHGLVPDADHDIIVQCDPPSQLLLMDGWLGQILRPKVSRERSKLPARDGAIWLSIDK